MDRIAIIDCGGSETTDLARRLADRFGPTVTDLDALYDDALERYPAGLVRRPANELVAAERWLIEGNHAFALPIRLTRADTVIFLNLPAWSTSEALINGDARRADQHAAGVYDHITQLSILRRPWTHGGGRSEDLARQNPTFSAMIALE